MEELKKLLEKLDISYEKYEHYISISSCQIGENYYDYGEDPPEEIDLCEEYEELRPYLDSEYLEITDCSSCWGCGTW